MHHVNPTCGDEVTLRVRLGDGRIAELGWIGEGCSISQASTSVMSDLVVGSRIADALQLQEKFLELMQSQGQLTLTEDEAEALEDAIAFAGRVEVPGAGQVRAARLDGHEVGAWREATSAARRDLRRADEERSDQP